VSGDPSGPGVVDVWWIDLDVDRDTVERCAALLVAPEIQRVASLATAELRRRLTVRLGQRRIVLAEALGVSAEHLELRNEPSGRPFAVAPDGERVSVSASSRGDVAVVACTRGRDVGIDVEAASELGAAPRLVERIASSAERSVLGQLDRAQLDDALVRLWTRKEALLKATGEGIGAGLTHLTVPLGTPVAGAFQPSSASAWWRCHDLECPHEGLVAALVVAARTADEPALHVRVARR
jgi:4'-phosphopantetheinyl transferase